MPIALLVKGARPRRVPVVGDEVRIGRGKGAHVLVEDARAAPVHAHVRYRNGEYILGGVDGASVYVNGKRVPFLALRHGDEVRLVDPQAGEATTLVFENRLGEAFVPPGASLASAWMAHAAFRDPANGPDRYGKGQALGGRERSRCRIVREEGGVRRLLVKVLGPVRSPEAGDEHLALLQALAGAPHPTLVPVVDGGLAPGADGPARWMVTVWVEGECLRDRLAKEGALDAPAALSVLRDLAQGVAWLHERGVIHRDVAPSNVVVTPTGHGVLIDPGQAVLAAAPRSPTPGVVGTPGYLAPEAILAGQAPLTPAADVYGLAAVGYALFTGRPPAAGEDVLEALARAASPPTRPKELGVELPPPLEAALLEALAPEPRARPTARQFEHNLAFAEAAIALGGEPWR